MANEKNLTPFSKEYQPKNRGRKKKFVTSLKADGYKASEVNDCITVMLSMTKDELAEMIKLPELTALEVIVGSAIVRASAKGDVSILETLISRPFGRPKEKIEQSGNVTLNHKDADKLDNLSTEELEQLAELKKKMNA
jgi:hypothetical protein